MKNTIVLTGGGTAGHVSGNLVLIPKCEEENWDIHYIGSEQGIERKLVSDYKVVTYHPISTGKLRRYLAWENVIDVFRVVRGIFQAYRLIKKLKPHVIFSKGGFVAVPVVLGARLNKVPIVIYEPDLNMGLANKISYPFAATICTAFKETAANLPDSKAVYTGPILQKNLKSENIQRALNACGFTSEKPVLLIMGGSLGADSINQMVKTTRHELLNTFQMVHICGKGKVDHTLSMPGYKAFEFVSGELADLLAIADVVVSRAGSNSIMELLALQKPMLLIPHTRGGSRSGQLMNAQYFEQAGFAELLLQEQMTAQSFIKAIGHLFENRSIYADNMNTQENGEGAPKIMELIKEAGNRDQLMNRSGF
ncbi:undecaprenyldiphospho-muramoylpentapeptide beta-N-acetylglucosaminyltransferase [Bacillus sp. FJAT-28004]|uniref:undecaprenyldiphospho-muramoylpentapeptide beta-N-acetylglucosaminyltransferase n=1 Tax=Bacillus sp. FJAT-28004 TaxID=1679165 RepID=UPI0006B46FDA|nr:undecaprenyldiphospho-muramoylpentapeptide beta-N-acetylglucosaminyltransferase [Bacillus sp. FJAT-28004]